MYKYVNTLLIFYITLSILIYAKENNDAEFTNIFCTADNITVKNISCRLISCRNKPRTVSIDFDIVEPIANANVHFEVFRRLNGYQPFVLNYTFDLGRSLKNKGLNPMTKIIMDWVVKKSNLKLSWPIQPQHYQLKELYPDLRLVPSLIPKGRFRADITTTNKNDSTIIIKAQFHFLNKDNF